MSDTPTSRPLDAYDEQIARLTAQPGRIMDEWTNGRSGADCSKWCPSFMPALA